MPIWPLHDRGEPSGAGGVITRVGWAAASAYTTLWTDVVFAAGAVTVSGSGKYRVIGYTGSQNLHTINGTRSGERIALAADTTTAGGALSLIHDGDNIRCDNGNDISLIEDGEWAELVNNGGNLFGYQAYAQPVMAGPPPPEPLPVMPFFYTWHSLGQAPDTYVTPPPAFTAPRTMIVRLAAYLQAHSRAGEGPVALDVALTGATPLSPSMPGNGYVSGGVDVSVSRHVNTIVEYYEVTGGESYTPTIQLVRGRLDSDERSSMDILEIPLLGEAAPVLVAAPLARARASSSTPLALPLATPVPVTFDTVISEQGTGLDMDGNRYVVPQAGWYRCLAQIEGLATATVSMQVRIYLDGALQGAQSQALTQGWGFATQAETGAFPATVGQAITLTLASYGAPMSGTLTLLAIEQVS